jgi:hypothetical protein
MRDNATLTEGNAATLVGSAVQVLDGSHVR